MAQRFLTLEAAIDLPDDECEGASACQLPPVEDGNITDEEHVNENDFSEDVPDDVCGHVEVMQCSDEDYNRLLHVRVLSHGERNQWGGNSLLEKDAKFQ
ncbi:hypothetical protein MRX96_018907 [Rhipicephalus microplus]